MHFGWQTRLARSSEIGRVFKEGKRHNCGVFLLIAARRNPEDTHRSPRLCVVASRKVSSRAVYRNRLKRRFRALYRDHRSEIPEDLDLILIARSSMLTTPYTELQKRFKKACANLEGS